VSIVTVKTRGGGKDEGGRMKDEFNSPFVLHPFSKDDHAVALVVIILE
jgi:hypothetical protein